MKMIEKALSSSYGFATIEDINKRISYYVYCIQIQNGFTRVFHPRASGSSLRKIKLF